MERIGNSEKCMAVGSEGCLTGKPRLDLLVEIQGVYLKQPREVERNIEENPSRSCVYRLRLTADCGCD